MASDGLLLHSLIQILRVVVLLYKGCGGFCLFSLFLFFFLSVYLSTYLFLLLFLSPQFDYIFFLSSLLCSAFSRESSFNSTAQVSIYIVHLKFSLAEFVLFCFFFCLFFLVQHAYSFWYCLAVSLSIFIFCFFLPQSSNYH